MDFYAKEDEYMPSSAFSDFDTFYQKYKAAHKYFEVSLSKSNDTRKTSYIWKFFGSLMYKNRIIFEKHNFCKLIIYYFPKFVLQYFQQICLKVKKVYITSVLRKY